MKPDTPTNPYNTILVIVVGFVILSRVFDIDQLLSVAIIIGVVSLIWRKLAEWIVLAWNLLAKGLSYVIPNILLGLIFYLLVTPLALISRIFAKEDPLMLENEHKSTFKTVNKSFDKASFEKMW